MATRTFNAAVTIDTTGGITVAIRFPDRDEHEHRFRNAAALNEWYAEAKERLVGEVGLLIVIEHALKDYANLGAARAALDGQTVTITRGAEPI